MTKEAGNRARLTKRHVESLAAPGFHWDSDLTGFHLRILKTGRKVYGFQYRDRAGRQHRPKIGVHGQISADQAREIARDWRIEVSAGRTPGAATGGGATMQALSRKYMTDYATPRKKPRSVGLDEIYWRVHTLPLLGNLTVASITPADIQKVMSRLKKKPATANRVRALLHKSFELAEDWKIRPRGTNPVKEVEKVVEPRARHRYLTPENLGKLGAALRQYEHAAMIAAPSGARLTPDEKEADARVRELARARRRFAGLVVLLLITGARKLEWMHGRWEWVDLERGQYRLPDSKTGAKTILLSPPAVAILNNLRELSVKGNPYIFPGTKPGKPLHEERAQWKNLLAIAGLEGVRIHDLRHSFASAAKSSGFDRAIVASLLHHSDEAVTDIYADLFDDVTRGAQNATADALIGWMER